MTANGYEVNVVSGHVVVKYPPSRAGKLSFGTYRAISFYVHYNLEELSQW